MINEKELLKQIVKTAETTKQRQYMIDSFKDNVMPICAAIAIVVIGIGLGQNFNSDFNAYKTMETYEVSYLNQ